MSEIARVRDGEGRVHFASRDSKFVKEGLSDGSLVDLDKEVPSAATDAQDSDDLNAGGIDPGPGERERAAGIADVGDNEGVAEPKARR